jgi:surface antigen
MSHRNLGSSAVFVTVPRALSKHRSLADPFGLAAARGSPILLLRFSGNHTMRIHRLLCLTAITATLAACAGDYEEPVTQAPPPPPPAPAPQLPPAPPPPPPTVVPREAGKVAGRDVGGAAARLLQEEDRAIMEKTTQKALATGAAGKSVAWSNPVTGASGAITPQPKFSMGGKSCREFQQVFTAGGKKSTGYGTACVAPDGTWLIDENG